jgi:hypothetical protein
MINSWLQETNCRSCGNTIEKRQLFCKVCGRDRFVRIKKWEYLLGGFALLIVFIIAIVGINFTINLVKSIPDAPTQKVVQIPSPTDLPPTPQSFESIPNTPTQPQPPTEIISTSVPMPTPCSEITITMTDTSKGDILHIERCSDGWAYDSPLIAKGVYGVAPNNKFLVYCSNDGYVYAVRFGDSNFRLIENIRKKMSIFLKNEDVSLSIIFIAGEYQYWVKITDRVSGQSTQVKIPFKISQ